MGYPEFHDKPHKSTSINTASATFIAYEFTHCLAIVKLIIINTIFPIIYDFPFKYEVQFNPSVAIHTPTVFTPIGFRIRQSVERSSNRMSETCRYQNISENYIQILGFVLYHL